jgi:hypothetical protein
MTLPDDPAELWGKRVGRALGWIAAAVLIFYFVWSFL